MFLTNSRSPDQDPQENSAQNFTLQFSVETIWGGYTPKQGFLKVPDALYSGQLERQFHLPPSATSVLLSAHKWISLHARKWVTRNHILTICALNESTIRRVLKACVKVGLATCRQVNRCTEYNFAGLYEFLKNSKLTRGQPAHLMDSFEVSKRQGVQVAGQAAHQKVCKLPTEKPSNHFKSLGFSATLQYSTTTTNRSIRYSLRKRDLLSNQSPSVTSPPLEATVTPIEPVRPTVKVDRVKTKGEGSKPIQPMKRVHETPHDVLRQNLIQDSRAAAVLDRIGANRSDTHALCGEAIERGQGVDSIVDALNAAIKFGAKNPVGYARKVLRSNASLPHASASERPSKPDEYKQSNQSIRQRLLEEQAVQVKRSLAETLLTQPAYGPCLALARSMGIEATLLAGWLSDSPPIAPEQLQGVLQSMQPLVTGYPIYQVAGVFFDQLSAVEMAA